MDDNAQDDRARQNEDIRGIARWTRRYAQNRTLVFIVFELVFLAGAALMGGLSILGAWAHKTGHDPLAVGAIIALVGFVVWWVWFSFVGAARLQPRITERLYRGEGQVSIGAPGEKLGCPSCPRWVVPVFVLCVLGHTVATYLDVTPIRYQQPISALYCVPFLSYLSVRMGKAGSPFMLLWPALYGLHAVLIVAGAPVYFERVEALNMLLPIVGYGIVAGVAGHVYSRVALRRLRALARSATAADEERGAGL